MVGRVGGCGGLSRLAAVSKWLPPGSLRGSVLVNRDASSEYLERCTFPPQGFLKLRFSGQLLTLKKKDRKKEHDHSKSPTSEEEARARRFLCAGSQRIPCPCFSAQLVTCDTKLRDQCKGTTCNRYGSRWS